MDIKVKRFDKALPLPKYEREGAACFDLTCRENLTISPKEIKLVPLNIAVKIPEGYSLLIFVRSSTPMLKGLMMANSIGIVDPFYCGDRDEVLAEFLNFTDQPAEIHQGDLLAQGMVIKHEFISWNEVEEMEEEGVGGYKINWSKQAK